uniref:Uncharacterized protein n=1 Tax=Arundo donax TaxID=35708 RepID=A0A0A9B058_ARUDO
MSDPLMDDVMNCYLLPSITL